MTGPRLVPAKAGAAAALRVGGELDLGGVPRIKSGGRPEWPTHVARCSRHRSAGSSLQPASQPSPPACAGTSLGLAKNRPDRSSPRRSPPRRRTGQPSLACSVARGQAPAHRHARDHPSEDRSPPCILPLPAETKPERLSVDGSPQPRGAIEPVKKHGAPSTGSSGNPNSRLGRKPSPHSQGRVMEQPATSPSFVGIDVSKDRLDVHVRPSGQT